jgi:hypothetical protein
VFDSRDAVRAYLASHQHLRPGGLDGIRKSWTVTDDRAAQGSIGDQGWTRALRRHEAGGRPRTCQRAPGLVAAVEAELGPIDILAANAALGHRASYEEAGQP